MHSRIFPVAIITLTSLAAGCTSTSSSTAPRHPVVAGTVIDAAASKLEKGMSADTVRKLLGKPAEITLRRTAEGTVEEWTYHRNFQRAEQVPAGMREVPAFVGPTGGSGGMGTMQEPIYTIEIHDIDETLKLLMFKGSLMEWKSAFTDRRSYG
jgi:outer membrane protein assembly factor BamE (lipoprotein component of BamABCDE complex)